MIRDAEPADITKIVARGALHHKELKMPWEFDEVSTAKTVLQLMQAGTLLVEDEIKGYIGYEIGGIYFNHDAKLATEHFWYVLPSERKTGLGTELLEAAKAKAKTQGATWFSVQLPPQSSAAIDLVENQGWIKMHGIYGVDL
jgi:GNAT superfamily N-acetyltransferase